MRSIIVGLMFLAGVLIPIQAAMNSRLSVGLGSPVKSSLISFFGGLLVLAAVLIFAEGHIARLVGMKGGPVSYAGIPWWAYLGGLCGAFYVLMATVAAPRIGVVATIALALLGQQITAIVIDTFGLFGVPKIPLVLSRVAGVTLVAGGVLLVQWKR